MFYFDKNDDRVLFQDIRSFETTLCDGRKFEIKPDIQADFTNMPYEDESFQMIVFDPPHLLRNVGNSKFAEIYGSLNEKSTFFQNSEALRKSFRKHISPVRIKCAILYLLITGWFGFLIKTSIYFSKL